MVDPSSDHANVSGVELTTCAFNVNWLPEKAVPPTGSRRMTGKPSSETSASDWFGPAAMATTFESPGGGVISPALLTPHDVTIPLERNASTYPCPWSNALQT